MEENTKRKPGRPRKPSTAKSPVAALGVTAGDAAKLKAAIDKVHAAFNIPTAGAAEKEKTEVKPKPVISDSGSVKVDKATARRLLDALAEKVDAAKKAKSQEDESSKFDVKGLIWEKDGEAVRTIFIDGKVYVEFPMTEDGSVTAFYPYTPYDESMGTSSVTFPADWLVLANAEQLAAMGCGATTITMSEEDDCCGCECDCDKCSGEDDDKISLDDLADFAISEMDITMDDIEKVIKNMLK